MSYLKRELRFAPTNSLVLHLIFHNQITKFITIFTLILDQENTNLRS